MKTRKRNIGNEIIRDLKALHRDLRSRAPLAEKYTVRTVGRVPEPTIYDADDVRAIRESLHASQAVFAQMVGVSAALVRAWEGGIRQPAPIARRLLDVIRRNPRGWQQMLKAA
jgi:putative transcriptional regulator